MDQRALGSVSRSRARDMSSQVDDLTAGQVLHYLREGPDDDAELFPHPRSLRLLPLDAT
jgi:hypothetical protein